MTGYRTGLQNRVNRLLARHIEKILAIPGAKLYRRAVRAAKSVEATQLQVLKEILRYAEGSQFGTLHRFNTIDSYARLKRRVPCHDYEALRPYVERHMAGEENVLFPGKPMMYMRTSGTTAKPKFVPVTEYNYHRTLKDRGKLWLYGLSRNYPGIYTGKDLTVVSPAVEGHAPDGTPYGALSGLIYQNIPEFVKQVHSIPYSAVTIHNHTAKQYTLLRCALAENITVIFAGNPATIVNLATRTDEWKERLIRDINDGTLDPQLEIDGPLRREIEGGLTPQKDRARFLDRLAATTDRLRPADYWPDLKLVHTWKNGNCRLVLPKLRPWFRDETPILDFGYIATEINATDLIDPQTDGSILQVLSGFYEFVPADEIDRPEPRFLMAHQLEIGAQYYLYVTSYSGLYRYEMNDVIEVVSFFHQSPVIRFLYKGKGITSIQGEKLSETQLIDAVQRAARITGVHHEFFIGHPDAEKSRYELYIELSPQSSDAQRAAFAEQTDRALCEFNLEYDAKRASERLAPIVLVPMGQHFFERYRELRLAEGALEGQLKWMHLSAVSATKERMLRLLQHDPCPPVDS